MLEKDPVAQRHAAKIRRLRGTYDKYGNREPPDFSKAKKKQAKRKEQRGKEGKLQSRSTARKPKRQVILFF